MMPSAKSTTPTMCASQRGRRNGQIWSRTLQARVSTRSMVLTTMLIPPLTALQHILLTIVTALLGKMSGIFAQQRLTVPRANTSKRLTVLRLNALRLASSTLTISFSSPGKENSTRTPQPTMTTVGTLQAHPTTLAPSPRKSRPGTYTRISRLTRTSTRRSLSTSRTRRSGGTKVKLPNSSPATTHQTT